MAGNYLTRSRHKSVYYFRRRVPIRLKLAIGKRAIVLSLETANRRLAIIRARAVAAQTDTLFSNIDGMTKKSKLPEGFQFDYGFKATFNDFGLPEIEVSDALAEDREAIDSNIRTFLEASGGNVSEVKRALPKSFKEAITEYFTKASIKAQSKATYRSKLDHAQNFFGGETADILKIDQAGLVRYSDQVLSSVANITTQGHYITTVAGFLNWHRSRLSGLNPLTVKTLVPKKDTPEAEERDAFTLEQLEQIFTNARRYIGREPCKFWVSVAPAFLGCRIEELCQIHLKSDLVKDEEAEIWYLLFDGRPDPDGVVRKSMKKPSSWRRVPIHSSLVRHGFVEFMQEQVKAGFQRPFEKLWKAREVTESDVGRIIKWSHYVSRWGGRELIKIAKIHGFDPGWPVKFPHLWPPQIPPPHDRMTAL